ncbi:MAG: hypothetical protein EZS28_024917 [Streblomastix strix]|uniref:Uncharacterized protein n=1 Tax=Streblomastix strix TaxID=222440 RepID=A0A5J4VAS9_9EUKA|nr:MAG: hypothetical protein EZS28_024917 [Streblomastix strix]
MIGGKSTFNDCCNHGKVEYPPVPEFNGIVKDIFNKVHPKHLIFKEYIRNYNSTLACASLRGDIQVIPGRGPYILRFQGIPIVQSTPEKHAQEEIPTKQMNNVIMNQWIYQANGWKIIIHMQ